MKNMNKIKNKEKTAIINREFDGTERVLTRVLCINNAKRLFKSFGKIR